MVVSSANFTKEFSPCPGLQSWVCSMNRRGLSTQPWGALLLSTRVEEERLPILGSVCEEVRYPVTEGGTDAQSVQFSNQLHGGDCVEAELKSTNSILM